MARFSTRAAAVAAATVGAVVLAAAPAYASPNPKPGLPAGVDTKLNVLLGMGMAVVIFACVAGVFACAGKLALALRHGEGAEAAGKLGAVGFACVLVGSAAGVVSYLS